MSVSINNLFNYSRSLPVPFDTVTNKIDNRGCLYTKTPPGTAGFFILQKEDKTMQSNIKIIPINHEAGIDDTLIRLVNEHHDRIVRERQEARERAIAEKQARSARRREIANQVLDALLCTVFGAAAMLGIIVLVL